MAEFTSSPTRSNLMRLEREEELHLADVAMEAGDVSPDETSRARLERMRKTRGQRYYVDLLFVLTHRRFEPESAFSLWAGVVQHRLQLTLLLGRNVGVAVAALDYLHNIEGTLRSPVLVESERLQRIATTATHDGLTGLYDHASLYEALQRELARAEREQQPVSVLMLDVDHFKRFNDRHGHVEGDRVLCRLATCTVACVRGMDVVARYGGEELCVVLPGADARAARETAERIRSCVEAEGEITVSLGTTTSFGEACTPRQLVDRADSMLYQAKRGGRNRVHCAPTSERAC